VTSRVKDLCHGKNECRIKASRATLNSDECDYKMKLIITYQCVDCSQYENRNKRSLSPIESDEHERFKRQGGSKLKFCMGLAITSMVFRNRATCPNQIFVNKHVCTHCVTHADVSNFAAGVAAYRAANGYAYTTLNSVFTGTPSYRQLGTRCQFTSSIGKYDCRLTAGNWNCYFQRHVIATHDLNTGHYFYQQDI
jgi:hypothetical protein